MHYFLRHLATTIVFDRFGVWCCSNLPVSAWCSHRQRLVGFWYRINCSAPIVEESDTVNITTQF